MKHKLHICIITLLFISIHSFSQIGGDNTYEFLNLPTSARVSALGGNNISIADDDINMPFYNPALLNKSMDNHLALNYIDYLTDINYAYVSYAKHIDKFGTFALGLNYLNYGKFIEADNTGVINGEFKATEYAFNLLWSYPLDSNFTFGANLKNIYSDLYIASSYGIAFDLGLTYTNKKMLLTSAFVLKNIGKQITDYNGNMTAFEGGEPLPFDVQIGITKKLKHAPFRLSITAENLSTYDMLYANPDNNKSEIIAEEPTDTTARTPSELELKVREGTDNFFRHIVFGVEFIPTKNLHINLGYNYQRRQELKLETRPFIVGFSWGIGFKISKFHISYSRVSYHLSGGTNQFSVRANLSEFYKKS